MSNPLKLRTHANGVYNNGVQVTTNAELDYIVKLINTKYATESGSGDFVGDLNIDSSGTSVGTFVDNFATGELLSHPYSGSSSSTTYTFKQNVSTASETSMVVPATHGGTSNPGHIKEQTSTELNNTIAQLCLDDIAKANSTYASAGSYYVSINAPSIGGTWVAQDQFYDEVTNHSNDDDQKVTYKLWRKTSHATNPAQVKLLKQSTTNLAEMSDTEIQTLVARLRNRIVSTGIGKYKFQATVPGTGTWVARGSATDRNPGVTNVQYTGTYSAQYANQFARQFTRVYSDQYVRGQFARQFASQYQRVYSGTYGRSFARGYTSTFARGVVGTNYAGPQYARLRPGPQYARSTPGPQYASTQYTRQFTRVYSGQYDRVYSSQFQRNYARGNSYAVSFSGSYSRGITYAVAYLLVYFGSYGRSTPGPQYTGNFTRQYGRVYNLGYNDSFYRQYTAQYARQFTRVYSANYGRSFLRQYTAQYTRSTPGPNYSDGQYTRSRPGPSYTVNYARSTPGPNYSDGQYARLVTGPNYTVNFARSTPGPNYSDGQYTRETPGPQYTVNYARSTPGPSYSDGDYTRSRPGPQYSVNYARSTPGPSYTDGQYARLVVGPTFATGFARTTPGPNYSDGQYSRATPGPQYTSTYANQFTGLFAGDTVQSTSSVNSTIKLWLRVA